MQRVVNVENSFEKFKDTWSPKIVAELNGQHIKLAKLDGDKCPWHAHDQEDEMFLLCRACWKFTCARKLSPCVPVSSTSSKEGLSTVRSRVHSPRCCYLNQPPQRTPATCVRKLRLRNPLGWIRD